MRVRTRGIPGDLTGKVDDLVIYRNRSGNKLFARKYVKIENHPGQAPFAAAQRAIYALQPSEGYKQNLRDYLIGYNRLPVNDGREAHSWNNLYNKLMFAMQKALPETVDLANITREQIFSQNLPCRSIKAAIEANLLPGVRDYERFTAEI